MDKSIIFNLVMVASLITLVGFFIDRHEFQGDYGVAAFEFIMMTSIIFVFFMLIYLGVITVRDAYYRIVRN